MCLYIDWTPPRQGWLHSLLDCAARAVEFSRDGRVVKYLLRARLQ